MAHLSFTPITARWNGGFAGSGALASEGFETRVTLPKDFQGLGEGASPESLLLGAAASCYLVTLGIMLDKAGIAYRDLTLEGSLATELGPRPTIIAIELRPRILSDAPRERLLELARKAEEFCLVSRALGGGVKKAVAPLEITALERRLELTQ